MIKKGQQNQEDGLGKYVKVESGKRAAETPTPVGLAKITADAINKLRWEFALVFGLVVAFAVMILLDIGNEAWILKLGGRINTLIIIAVIAFAVFRFFYPPKGTYFLRLVLIAIVGLWVWGNLPAESGAKQWLDEKTAEAPPLVVLSSQFESRNIKTIKLSAPPDRFEWVTIPDGAELYKFGCPFGTFTAIVHRDKPEESIHDCDKTVNEIALGKGLRNLRFGFKSKSNATVPVEIRLLSLL